MVKKFIGGMVGMVFLAMAGTAEAAFMMRLKNGEFGPWTTIVDQGAGDVTSGLGLAGVITFIGSIGDFALNVTVGTSKPLIGSAINPQLNLTAVSANNIGGAVGKLFIELTDTDFIAPVPTATVASVLNGTRVPGLLSLNTFLDNGNIAFGKGTPLASIGPFGPALIGDTGGGEINSNVPTVGPYSLTMAVEIDHSFVLDTTTFDASVIVAEPASLILFGVGFTGMGILIRRRRKAAKRST